MTEKPTENTADQPKDEPEPQAGSAGPDTDSARAGFAAADSVASESSGAVEPSDAAGREVPAADVPAAAGSEAVVPKVSGAAVSKAAGAAPSEPAGSTESAAAASAESGVAKGADPAAPVGSAVARSQGLLAALVVAVVLLIGAAGGAGYLYVQDRDKAELLAAHDEVLDAACRYAPVLANYDAKNLDPYFSAVLAGATGDWKKEFETTTGELREALVAGEVVSTAGDIQCAVKTADATSAEVVVVIGQTISSLGTRGQPAPGQLAMVMRMQKSDGRWLVDRMDSPLAMPAQ